MPCLRNDLPREDAKCLQYLQEANWREKMSPIAIIPTDAALHYWRAKGRLIKEVPPQLTSMEKLRLKRQQERQRQAEYTPPDAA